MSDLLPHTAHVRRRSGGDPVVPGGRVRALGGAVSALHRPHHSGISEHGVVGAVRAGLGERFAARLRRDAGSERRPSKPASRCTPTASCRRFISRACSAPGRSRCSIWNCRRGSSLAQRRKTLGLIRELDEATDDAGRRGVFRAAEHLRSRVQDADRSARGVRHLEGAAARAGAVRRRRPESTDDYGRRCLLARRLVEKGVRVVVRGVGRARRSRSGTRTTTSKRTICAWRRTRTSRSPAC